jgi:8-oxo-dGTP diphosphatase
MVSGMAKSPLTAQQLHFAILATDVALFTIRDGQLLVRLSFVNRPPHFPNSKGLPGGLIKPQETAEESVARIIETKACISRDSIHIEQLYTFSAINRDPRGRVVAVAYLALVPWEALSPLQQADTAEAWWSPLSRAKKLAYDHDLVLPMALKRLASRITYTTLISKLLPKEFTLTDLENAYKSILGTHLDKRNFRKKILKLDILKELPRKRQGGAFRPAQLYRFNTDAVKEIEVL